MRLATGARLTRADLLTSQRIDKDADALASRIRRSTVEQKKAVAFRDLQPKRGIKVGLDRDEVSDARTAQGCARIRDRFQIGDASDQIRILAANARETRNT